MAAGQPTRTGGVVGTAKGAEGAEGMSSRIAWTPQVQEVMVQEMMNQEQLYNKNSTMASPHF
jgi:hypothetical protein